MEVRDVNTHGGGHVAGKYAAIKREENPQPISSGAAVIHENTARPVPAKQSNATQTEGDMYGPSAYAAPVSHAECMCAACVQQHSHYPSVTAIHRIPTSLYGTTAAQQHDMYAAPTTPQPQTPVQPHPGSSFVQLQRSAGGPPPPPMFGASRLSPSTAGGYHQHERDLQPYQQHQAPRSNVIQHQPYQLYGQLWPSQQQVVPSPPPNYTPIYNRAVTAPTVRDANSLVDPSGELLRNYAGRVVELACTSDGRTMLINALASQDAALVGMMVREIAEDLERVALDTHGCHVLRALQGYTNVEHTKTLVSCFTETLVLNLCTATQHTRHILESLFQRQLIDLQPIVDVLASNAPYLAATQQGCISFMHILECCSPSQKRQLISPLLPCFAQVALDPYGNYVVQRIIQNIGPDAAEYVTSRFVGELLNMSCNKFGSNVVEETIKVCGAVPAVRRLLMNELVAQPGALQQLVHDSFGNFVVQTFIGSSSDAGELRYINERLRPVVHSSPYAARIETKIRAALASASKRGLVAAAGPQHHVGHSSHHHPAASNAPAQMSPVVPPRFAASTTSFVSSAPHHQRQQQQQCLSPRCQPVQCNRAPFAQRRPSRRQHEAQAEPQLQLRQ